MGETLDNISKDNNKEFKDINNLNRLCVHDLKKKLRIKQRKQLIKKSIILSIVLIFFGLISLLIYQSL